MFYREMLRCKVENVELTVKPPNPVEGSEVQEMGWETLKIPRKAAEMAGATVIEEEKQFG